LLLIPIEWETALWWIMLSTGVAAAGIGIAANALDRRKANWPARHKRFWLHIASYGLLSISILAFALRGLSTPA
jgi:hypothetical protein